MKGPTRSFRFACRARSSVGPFDARTWSDLARKTEDLGFDLLVVADHVRTAQAPLPALAYAAAKTNHLRLGIEVLNNDFRHPAVLAKELATVDVLSEGRLEIGLGCGYRRQDYDTTGIPFRTIEERAERLAETVGVLKSILGQSAPSSYDGEYHKLRLLPAEPRAHQHPHPPLVIGGRSQRLLALAAAEADTYSIPPGDDPRRWTIDHLDRLSRRALALARAADNDLEIHLLPKGCYIGPAAESFLVKYAARKRVSPDVLQTSAHTLAGSPTQVAEHLCMLYERAGVSYVTVPSDCADAFAPVMSMVRTSIQSRMRSEEEV